MIEPTDEMVQAFRRAFNDKAAEMAAKAADFIEGSHITRAGLAAVLAIVERDYDVLPIPPEATAPEQDEICGAVYVDPDRSDRPPVAPCGKSLGHENGPTTDWKRGYHSNGMFKWPVES